MDSSLEPLGMLPSDEDKSSQTKWGMHQVFLRHKHVNHEFLQRHRESLRSPSSSAEQRSSRQESTKAYNEGAMVIHESNFSGVDNNQHWRSVDSTQKFFGYQDDDFLVQTPLHDACPPIAALLKGPMKDESGDVFFDCVAYEDELYYDPSSSQSRSRVRHVDELVDSIANEGIIRTKNHTDNVTLNPSDNFPMPPVEHGDSLTVDIDARESLADSAKQVLNEYTREPVGSVPDEGSPTQRYIGEGSSSTLGKRVATSQDEMLVGIGMKSDESTHDEPTETTSPEKALSEFDKSSVTSREQSMNAKHPHSGILAFGGSAILPDVGEVLSAPDTSFPSPSPHLIPLPDLETFGNNVSENTKTAFGVPLGQNINTISNCGDSIQESMAVGTAESHESATHIAPMPMESDANMASSEYINAHSNTTTEQGANLDTAVVNDQTPESIAEPDSIGELIEHDTQGSRWGMDTELSAEGGISELGTESGLTTIRQVEAKVSQRGQVSGASDSDITSKLEPLVPIGSGSATNDFPDQPETDSNSGPVQKSPPASRSNLAIGIEPESKEEENRYNSRTSNVIATEISEDDYAMRKGAQLEHSTRQDSFLDVVSDEKADLKQLAIGASATSNLDIKTDSGSKKAEVSEIDLGHDVLAESVLKRTEKGESADFLGGDSTNTFPEVQRHVHSPGTSRQLLSTFESTTAAQVDSYQHTRFSFDPVASASLSHEGLLKSLQPTENRLMDDDIVNRNAESESQLGGESVHSTEHVRIPLTLQNLQSPTRSTGESDQNQFASPQKSEFSFALQSTSTVNEQNVKVFKSSPLAAPITASSIPQWSGNGSYVGTTGAPLTETSPDSKSQQLNITGQAKETLQDASILLASSSGADSQHSKVSSGSDLPAQLPSGEPEILMETTASEDQRNVVDSGQEPSIGDVRPSSSSVKQDPVGATVDPDAIPPERYSPLLEGKQGEKPNSNDLSAVVQNPTQVDHGYSTEEALVAPPITMGSLEAISPFRVGSANEDWSPQRTGSIALEETAVGIVSPPRTVRESGVKLSNEADNFADIWTKITLGPPGVGDFDVPTTVYASPGTQTSDLSSPVHDEMKMDVPEGNNGTILPQHETRVARPPGSDKKQPKPRIGPADVPTPRAARSPAAAPFLRTMERARVRKHYDKPTTPHRIRSPFSPGTRPVASSISPALSPARGTPQARQRSPSRGTPTRPLNRTPTTPASPFDRRNGQSPFRDNLCTRNFIFDIHPTMGPCERCWSMASSADQERFISRGSSLSIVRTKGGCERSCESFPREEGEPPVRLCRKCFFATHSRHNDHLQVYRGRTKLYSGF